MAASSTFISTVATGLLLSFIIAEVESIGVCYGRAGNNLPQSNGVISLNKSNNIGGIRLYDYNQDIFQALRGTNMVVIVDNPDPSAFSSDSFAVYSWVQNYIQAFQNVNFRYKDAGNELIPSPIVQNILPVMHNLHNALQSTGLHDQIKVSTSISTDVFNNTYPPSAGVFSSIAIASLQPIINFLVANGAPLLINVYISKLIQHVGQGTPKRPENSIEIYLFAMFDENFKQLQGIEDHYGLFNPRKEPKYSLSF